MITPARPDPFLIFEVARAPVSYGMTQAIEEWGENTRGASGAVAVEG